MSDEKSDGLGGLLKKAVTIGAGAYVSAEDRLRGTLNAVQIPKEMIKEAIENFFESYTISINAEIKFSPKKKETAKTPESDNSGGAV